MAETKKTAQADEKDVPEAVEKKPAKISEPIKGARIIAMPTATGTTPAVIYRGEVPAKGTKLRLDMGEVTYAGIVADATEADGEVLVEFRDGLTPEA